MGLLNGGAAEAFASIFGTLFLDADLYRPVAGDDDGMGGGDDAGFADAEPVKAQLDAATQTMRDSAGYVDTDMRILVIANGVAPINTDCEIDVDGTRWMIANVGQDPAKSYYDLHGRRKS